MIQLPEKKIEGVPSIILPQSRRRFIGYTGATLATAAFVIAGCKKDDDPATPPTATFTFASTGLVVTFTNTSTNAKAYSWDFGDSTVKSTEKSPVHTYAAAGSYTVILTVTGNDNSTKTYTQTVNVMVAVVSLGSGDVGILNYAYALEQLEAAFYTAVVTDAMFTTTFTDANERKLLTDIRDHEIAHREFFKAALATNAIKGLTPDFSTIDFKNRTSVLAAAKTFEDLGVMAYNGAGKLFSDTGAGLDYLVLAGKIVSVEARHAAWIADRITPGSFSATTDAQGMDTAMAPPAVLTAAKPFIKDTIDASNLPV